MADIPTTITAGDSTEWTETADTATELVTYAFRSHDGEGVTVEGVNAADVHTFTLTPGETAILPAGRYQTARIVEDAGERTTTAKAELVVRPDISAPHVPSYNRQMVDALKASIAGDAPRFLESHSINGFSVGKMSIAEKQRLLADYEARLAREQDRERNARGAASRRGIQIEF